MSVSNPETPKEPNKVRTLRNLEPVKQQQMIQNIEGGIRQPQPTNTNTNTKRKNKEDVNCCFYLWCCVWCDCDCDCDCCDCCDLFLFYLLQYVPKQTSTVERGVG